MDMCLKDVMTIVQRKHLAHVGFEASKLVSQMCASLKENVVELLIN